MVVETGIGLYRTGESHGFWIRKKQHLVRDFNSGNRHVIGSKADKVMAADGARKYGAIMLAKGGGPEQLGLLGLME